MVQKPKKLAIMKALFPSVEIVNNLPRDGEFPAVFQSGYRRLRNPSAAGNLHTHDGDAFYIVFADNLGQLIGIIHAVQLRTADKRNVAFDKPLMKSRIRHMPCQSAAISSFAPSKYGAFTGTSFICTGH